VKRKKRHANGATTQRKGGRGEGKIIKTICISLEDFLPSRKKTGEIESALTKRRSCIRRWPPRGFVGVCWSKEGEKRERSAGGSGGGSTDSSSETTGKEITQT